MKFLHQTILLVVTLLAGMTPAGAQESEDDRRFYRVEAIVFTHVGGQADDWPVQALGEYDAALDPVWRAFGERQQDERAELESGRDDLASALDMVETLADLESGERTLTQALLYPEPWLAAEALSEPMSRALERLERDGSYRVREVLGWHQPLDGPGDSRSVRIHDDRILGADWVTLLPTGRLTVDGRTVTRAEQLAPRLRYRLDGTLRLRQRQFLHADVDLRWQVREIIGPSLWPAWGDAGNFTVHHLEQSRAVRPQRFEYFDSDWLGLLLRITPFEPELIEESTEADPDSERQIP